MADDAADAPDAPLATEVDLAPQQPPPPKARNRRVALGLGALAVAAAGVFAAVSLAGESNGPEDPVRAMFAAAEQGDVLGVLAQLDPGERDALQGPITDLVDELNRLDVLDDADLGHVSGVDLQVDGLDLRSTVVRDDVARVTIEGGRASTSVDPSKLPLGDFIRDLAGEGLDEAEPDRSTSQLDTADEFVATVKRGDRWYVSIGYSVAELARRDAGVSFAEMGPGVAPKGTDTPEEAVRQLVEASTKLDVRRIIELLPPGELGALQEYAGLFIDEAEQAKDEAGDEVQLEVSGLELDSEVDGDHGLVFLRDGAFSMVAGDFAVKYADGCVDLTQPPTIFSDPTAEAPTSTHFCNGTDPAEALKGLGFEGIDPPTVSVDEQPKLGIAVTRVDGKWYVSPTRTMLGSLASYLKVFEPGDLKEMARYVQEVFTTSMERAFSIAEGSTSLDGTTEPGSVDVFCAQLGEDAPTGMCPTPASVPTTTTAPAG